MQALVDKIGRCDFNVKHCSRWFANQRAKEVGVSMIKNHESSRKDMQTSIVDENKNVDSNQYRETNHSCSS
jgi:hypothetical protein